MDPTASVAPGLWRAQAVKIKSQKDFWSGLLFLAVGSAFAAGATHYRFGSSAQPGPGYFPFGLGVLLAVLGAVLLLTAVSIETVDGDPIGPWAFRPLGVLVASVALFGYLLPQLGLLLALALLVLMSSLAGNEFRWREVLLNMVVLSAGAWLVFIQGLNLLIPVLPVFAR